MPFKLPHLDQSVELLRGEAAHVVVAMNQVVEELLQRDPERGQRWTPLEALSLAPLHKLHHRLAVLADRDEMPNGKKKHQLRVPYDQLTALRCFYGRLLACGSYPEARIHLLATPLGKFHQPSLNIETHVRLQPPTGPGCQMAAQL